MEDRIKLLAKWLNEVDPTDFGYDSYHSGDMERGIAYAQVAVCQKIGSHIEEILNFDSQQVLDNLKQKDDD